MLEFNRLMIGINITSIGSTLKPGSMHVRIILGKCVIALESGTLLQHISAFRAINRNCPQHVSELVCHIWALNTSEHRETYACVFGTGKPNVQHDMCGPIFCFCWDGGCFSKWYETRPLAAMPIRAPPQPPQQPLAATIAVAAAGGPTQLSRP